VENQVLPLVSALRWFRNDSDFSGTIAFSGSRRGGAHGARPGHRPRFFASVVRIPPKWYPESNH
jgi:hypothetical protein